MLFTKSFLILVGIIDRIQFSSPLNLQNYANIYPLHDYLVSQLYYYNSDSLHAMKNTMFYTFFWEINILPPPTSNTIGSYQFTLLK